MKVCFERRKRARIAEVFTEGVAQRFENRLVSAVQSIGDVTTVPVSVSPPPVAAVVPVIPATVSPATAPVPVVVGAPAAARCKKKFQISFSFF